MDKRELEIMVPFKDMREYVLKTRWTFTDTQRATLLANSWVGGQPLEDQFHYLRILRDNTDDMELKGQITTYLGRMERRLRELKDNQGGRCIYVLKVETDREGDNYRRIAPKMCFSTWESACAYGEKQKCRFQIEKILLADGTADAPENELISYMEFDRDGRAVYLSHTYDNVKEEEFIKAFLPLPNPFERGDVVRRVGSNRPEDYGIVETSQKRHKENYERWKDDPNHFTEFGDDRIRVAFLCNDGTFSHAHIFPMYLERYQPEWDSYNIEGSPLDNLLLSASEMYQGKGSLDELW